MKAPSAVAPRVLQPTATQATRPSRRFFDIGRGIKLLLVAQLAFNTGFFLVVPFLADHMKNNLHLVGWMIGLVLGIRTFSQQGLFFLGGSIVDRIGVKPSIIAGCLVRIVGFITVALADGVALLTVGVILIGVAAALFSPAVEAAIAQWAADEEPQTGVTVAEVWGLEAVVSKVGSVCGPLLGSVLLVVPFSVTALIAAVIFSLILLVLLFWLPSAVPGSQAQPVVQSLRKVSSDKAFMIFALAHSSYLLAFNQLYFMLPAELDRRGIPGPAITWFFALAAVMALAFQVPTTRLATRIGEVTSLRIGYLLLGVCFVPPAAAALWELSGWWRFLPAVAFVVLLQIGQMLTLPLGRVVTGKLAQDGTTASYLGALSSIGGIAVVLGSPLIGYLLDLGSVSNQDWLPWAALCLPGVLAAYITTRVLPQHHALFRQENP